jgi:hypothetical protein
LASLLAGAALSKRNLASPGRGGRSRRPIVQADPAAWQRTTDLNNAELAVQDRVKELNAARAKADSAEMLRRQVQSLDAFQTEEH